MSVKQCSKCGASFGCSNPEPGCWCEQYSLSGESLAYLKKNYSDCLCPDCLAGYANNNDQPETAQTNKE